MDRSSNPGAATPQSLHQLYSRRAATTANPFVLHDTNLSNMLSLTGGHPRSAAERERARERESLLRRTALTAPCASAPPVAITLSGGGARSAFRVVNERRPPPAPHASGVTLTLNSLDMSRLRM